MTMDDTWALHGILLIFVVKGFVNLTGYNLLAATCRILRV